MKIPYKNKSISKTYLILLSLIMATVLMVGTTFGRYLTQSKHDVVFLADKPTKIYLNQSELFDKTLFQPQMTVVDTDITSIFTLSNYDSQGNPATKKITFHVRAFVVRQEGYLPPDDAPSLEISLLDDINNVGYSSKVERVSKKTEFYQTNEKIGEHFCFYQTQSPDSEMMYTLEGENNKEITFTLIAKNIDFSAEDFFVYVELVK